MSSSTTAISPYSVSALFSFFRTPPGKLVLVALLSTTLTTATVLSTQAIHRKTVRKSLRDQIESDLQRRRVPGDRKAVEREDMQEEFEGEMTEDDKRRPQEELEEELVDFTRSAPAPNIASSSTTLNGSGGKGKKKKQTSEVIIREALARNYVFFGDEGMEKIRDSFVIIVGLGGVGSAAATMLVRSGVKKVRLVDFDQVSLSSLNRHSTATLAQVGTPKVTSCKDYFESVAPWVEVDARIELFGRDNTDELFEGNPTYVLDCIDNIDSKVDLLAYCHEKQLPVFSCLGAASKSDPSTIQISDISNTFEDPLARSVRRRLKLRGILSGIPVVYSTEKARSEIALLPLPDEEYAKGHVGELSALANFRVRILPVLGPLPAMFGNAAAAYVLQKIAGFKLEPLPVKNRRKQAAVIHRQLATREFGITGSQRIPVTEEEIHYLYEEIHRCRSILPPHAVPTKAVMVPWRKEGGGVAFDNLVLFEKEDADRHEEHVLKGNEDPAEFWGPQVAELVETRFREARRLRPYQLS